MPVSSSNFGMWFRVDPPNMCSNQDPRGFPSWKYQESHGEYLYGNGRQVAGLLDPLRRTVIEGDITAITFGFRMTTRSEVA